MRAILGFFTALSIALFVQPAAAQFPTLAVTPGSGTTINTLPNAGQAISANSLPVVLPSDYTLPAFAAPPAVTQSGTWTVQPGNTANTTPWLATINQGSNSAVVKAASTAAAAADPALAVAVSPNNIVQTGSVKHLVVFPTDFGGTTSTEYVAGESIGGLITFTDAFRTVAAERSGTITRVAIENQVGSTAPMRLYIFNQSSLASVTCTNNTVFAWDAGANPYSSGPNRLTTIDVTPAIDIVGKNLAIGEWRGADDVVSASNSANLYGCLVAQATYNSGAGYTQWVKLVVRRD